MAVVPIQILRSNTSSQPASLLGGQLAYTSVTDTLWIGSPNSSIISIGGIRTPGTLVANQSLVANSTMGINRVYAANVDVSVLNANGLAGTIGYVLTSGGGVSNTYWAAPVPSVNTNAQYIWSNTHIFSNLVTFSSNLNIGNSSVGISANSSSFIFQNLTSQLLLNPSSFVIGNSSVNTSTNSSSFFSGNSTFYAWGNSIGDYITSPIGTTSISSGQITVNANATSLLQVGNSSVFTTVNSTSFSGTSNNSLYLGGTPVTAFIQNNFSGALTGNVSLNGTNTSITSNVSMTGTIFSAPSTSASFQNVTVSGNVVVSGTLVTVSSQSLLVNNHFIELGEFNTSTDTLDVGIFSPAGNSTSTWYSGFARIAGKSSNTNPWFMFYGSNTNPNTSLTIDTTSNTQIGTVQAYLAPFGVGGAFYVNSTSIGITANSTLSASIIANNLTLSSALSVFSGGTGIKNYAAGDLLYAATANPSTLSNLSAGSNGSILQIVNGIPSWATSLDSGTF